IPLEDRFDPEKLALDLHRSGTKASYTPDVGMIVKQLAQSAAPGDVVIVLSNEEGIVGTVALDVLSDDAVLRALFVHSEFRGSGYGWMLADMAVSQAR